MTNALNLRIALVLTAAVAAVPASALAAYRGDTDTGFQHLYFI